MHVFSLSVFRADRRCLRWQGPRRPVAPTWMSPRGSQHLQWTRCPSRPRSHG